MSYKVDRASKDKYDREKNLNKLMNKLNFSQNPSSWILSHICLSYVTYACYKSAEFILYKQGILLSHSGIKDKLNKVEATIYKDKTTQEVYFFPNILMTKQCKYTKFLMLPQKPKRIVVH